MKIKYLLPLIFLVVVLIYLIIYLCFNVSPEKFGPIGDSVGGILGPILTFFAAYFAFMAFKKESENLNEVKTQTDILKRNLQISQEQNSKFLEDRARLQIKEKVEDIADTFQFLEDRINQLQYINRKNELITGSLVIEQLINDLGSKDNALHLMNDPSLKPIQVCNDIFSFACSITLDFKEDIKQRSLLIWELVLLYETYFSTLYSVRGVKHVFDTALTEIIQQRDSKSYPDKSWLITRNVEELQNSIEEAKSNFNLLLAEHVNSRNAKNQHWK